MLGKQLTGLSNASQKKKRESLLKTEKAIAKLIAQKQKITIRSVAREAGVSVSYIYKYPELSYKIQKLREQQKYNLQKGDCPSENVDRQVKKLQQEKAELTQEITELRAIINRRKIGENSLVALKAENIQLIVENRQLKKELQYTKQNLQEAREFIIREGCNNQNQLKLETKTKIIREIL